jgi:signal transduction histidine kinase
VKKESEFQRTGIPLQDTLANNFSALTTGNYIKIPKNFDDLIITSIFLFFIFVLPLKFRTRIFLFLSVIPFWIAIVVFSYLISNTYLDVSRSIVILVLFQYFGLPLVFLWKYKNEESSKLYQLNEARINALIAVSEQVAHDLRSPLSTINLMLTKAHFSNEEIGNLVKNSLVRIDNIIEEILAAAKFTKQPKMLQKIDLFEVINQIIKERELSQIQVKFENDVAPNTKVIADKLALTRALINIVENAIAAFDINSDSRKVKFHGFQNQTTYILSIIDNGPGIPQEILALLGEKKVTSKKGTLGTGIGFLLSKKMIADMGGDLKISSSTEKGTTISITLNK